MKAFALACIAIALAVAVLMLVTTPRASIRASIHDRQAMWGMLRRLFYLSVAGGNMGMGLWAWSSWVDLSFAMMAFWLMTQMPIAVFLALRACRLIDQDYWIGGRPRQERRPTTTYEVADEFRDIAQNIQNPARKIRALRAVADLETMATRH